MNKVIIDVPTLGGKDDIVNGSLASGLIVKAYKSGIFISEDATNGDVIKALFPNIDTSFSNVVDMNLWWKAKYKVEHFMAESEE